LPDGFPVERRLVVPDLGHRREEIQADPLGERSDAQDVVLEHRAVAQARRIGDGRVQVNGFARMRFSGATTFRQTTA
jgi:hypothetical protein